MNKIFYIPPFAHLYNLPKFVKNKNISNITKISVITENVLLYLLVGIISGIYEVKLQTLIAISIFALMLSPVEWVFIKFIKNKINESITNWKNFYSKETYYFLQYQLFGYVFIGYFIGIAFSLII